jgi:DNA-binding transcriptional MerR regulator
MRESSLTISQLAAHVGVTVRAVRHYHARGLLREPARDTSGYRRYDAQAVIDLIRIKTLAEAGVPLARIRRLLGAPPAEFAAEVTAIDRSLQTRIREMQQNRRRLGELAAGERLFLPAKIVELLDDLRALGVSERTVQIERDGWILASALLPQPLGKLVEEKKALLRDPDFQHLYVATDQAIDWDPADPRLDGLGDLLVDFSLRHQKTGNNPPDWNVGAPTAASLLFAHVKVISPAWFRLNEIAQEKLRGLSQRRADHQPARRSAR